MDGLAPLPDALGLRIQPRFPDFAAKLKSGGNNNASK
jgi:hypothetical protein